MGVLVVIAVLATLGVGGFIAIDRLSEDEPVEQGAVDDVGLTTAEVIRTDLVERETLDGTLRYANPGVVMAQAPGTVTALSEPGTIAERGDVLYEIDGRPVVLFFGDRPAWRPLTTASSDGPDIRQLEENLVALGFDEDLELTVDDEFTDLTADLVEEWQDSLDVESTGSVALGAVVYLPGPVRIGEMRVELGSVVGLGVPVMDVSDSTREVLVLLEADRQDLMAAGDAVAVELPDGSVVDGVVREVGSVVTTSGAEGTGGGGGPGVVEVVVDLVDPTDAGGLDRAPVEVEVVSEEALGVLAVPVEALIALAEGGYAVELQEGTATRLVGVEIGKFAGNLVEIVGEVNEGDIVLVPK